MTPACHQLVALCLLFIPAAALPPPPQPARAPLPLHSPVQDKNFYLLSLIERLPAAKQAIQTDPELSQLAAAKRAALAQAAQACEARLACYADALKWTDSDAARAAAALTRLYRDSAAVRQLVDGPLRRSGVLIRYQSKTGEDLLAQAWSDIVQNENRIVDVYGLGVAPRYPALDSISYDVKTEPYGRLVHTLAQVLDDDRAHLVLFFQPSLRFALGLLDANHRDEAGRLEPLEAGENKAALQRAKTLAWNKFPYSVIVVPGSGPDRENFALSPWGKLRLTLAVRRFHQGKAPFLLVSGGYVNPSQTLHCEALEMKHSLMADFGIPENAILIEPHARHTTTNLRNAVRQIYRYGFPFDKPGLIVTDEAQSTGIESAAFATRCLNEMGVMPVRDLRRLSPFDLTFTSVIDALQVDARDPLDP